MDKLPEIFSVPERKDFKGFDSIQIRIFVFTGVNHGDTLYLFAGYLLTRGCETM